MISILYAKKFNYVVCLVTKTCFIMQMCVMNVLK
jgi:hypothetical protein